MHKNFARLIRLQLKTGYISEAPDAYQFLKRYPPNTRYSKPPIEEVKPTKIPYYHLYEKAVERNPLYADEKMYPAFWQEEPHALLLAKKQFQFMQAGMDEDLAYVHAVKHINDLESEAFLEFQKLSKEMKQRGASVTIASDSMLAEEIAMWREKMKWTPFEDMDVADQGEIDYLIQTKILKWGEAARERRMRDPLFLEQFEALRAVIFPEINDIETTKYNNSLMQDRELFKQELFSNYKINPSQLTPAAPFYFSDYEHYFNKVVAMPDLSKWDELDRAQFFRWVVNTLAVQDVMKSSSSSRVHFYLEDIRAKFFPMIMYPDRANEFKLPDVQTMKKLLYNNDIGYKTDNNKLYIKRFYRLPMLLFPVETSKVMRLYTSNVSAGSFGGKMMKNKSIEDIRRELEPFSQANTTTVGALSIKDLIADDREEDDANADRDITDIRNSSVKKNNSTVIEDILSQNENDLNAEFDNNFSSFKQLSSVDGSGNAVALDDEDENEVELTPRGNILLEIDDILSKMYKSDIQTFMDSVFSTTDEYVYADQRMSLLTKIDVMTLPQLKAFHKKLVEFSVLNKVSTPDQRFIMQEKYNPTVKNALEQLRSDMFDDIAGSYTDCVTENEFLAVYESRLEAEMLMRARAAVQYEQREGARREREWAARELVDMPHPMLPFDVNGLN